VQASIHRLLRHTSPAHLPIALTCTELILRRRWIGMHRGIPDPPGWTNPTQVVLGFAMLPLGLVCLAACTPGRRWQLCIPWLAGDPGAVGADLTLVHEVPRPAADGRDHAAALRDRAAGATGLTALTSWCAWAGHGGR
jgi:hypothetical protein